MPTKKRRVKKSTGGGSKTTLPGRGKRKKYDVELPTEPREPTNEPWAFAYHWTGEKKIGKTSFFIEAGNSFVMQFDKPQLAYEIKEILVKDFHHSRAIIEKLEEAAGSGDFPYEMIVVDGVAEWYQMHQAAACDHFKVDHPSEEGYARAWHWLRDEFTDSVNRILSLQESVQCGVAFISHGEWKEVETRSGRKIEKLVPNMAARCEEIVNGKVDGWFAYDWDGDDRVLIVVGNERTGAGHRIDGHFLTPDGRRVREIHMGSAPSESVDRFLSAFNNEQEYATLKELRDSSSASSKKKRRKKKSRSA